LVLVGIEQDAKRLPERLPFECFLQGKIPFFLKNFFARSTGWECGKQTGLVGRGDRNKTGKRTSKPMM